MLQDAIVMRALNSAMLAEHRGDSAAAERLVHRAVDKYLGKNYPLILTQIGKFPPQDASNAHVEFGEGKKA